MLSGCLPGQKRSTSRALFPADSLSRQIAEVTPEDTLQLVRRTEGPSAMRYPLTLAWLDGRIVVADAQEGTLHTFSESGDYLKAFDDPALQFPFLAGSRGDTLAVLSRGRQEVYLVRIDASGGGEIVERVPFQDGRNPVGAWGKEGIFVKTADEARGSMIARYDPQSGAMLAEYPLDPPFWQHIGFLQTWGDTLVSLSGYRPVVRVLPTDARSGARADTLALMGFDSPQLARSRQFAVGDLREPPLLVPSAAGAGDRLFVLNARPGWVHVDVFRRHEDELRLEVSLLSPGAEMGRNFFAGDLVVRASGGGFDIVVLETRPRPAIAWYRWNPDIAAPSIATLD